MRSVIKKIKKMLRPYISLELAGILFTFLSALGSFLTPLASEYLIDEVLIADQYKKLLYGILIFVVVCMIQPVSGVIRDLFFIKVTENVTSNIRRNIFARLLKTSFTFFGKLKSGDIISIIMNDGRGASNFISNVFSIALRDIILVILIVTGMSLKSWKITFLVFGIFVVYFVINYNFSKFNRKLSKQVQENYDDICGCINRSYNGILAIKSYGTEDIEIERYNSVISRMKKTNVTMDSFRSFSNGITSMILISCLGVIYGLGAYYVLNGSLTVGNVIALGLYFQLLEQPFFELTNLGINIHVVSPILERIEKYENIEQEDVGIADSKFEYENIAIRNLHFDYLSEVAEKKTVRKCVFDNASFELPNKGLVILRGESGSGKSTFIRILMGLLPVDKNMVFYGNRDINDLSLATLRSNIAYVPQELDLINDTFYNNLTYGLENFTSEQVYNVCIRMNIDRRINESEKGYETIINEKANLSGGEKQRILIARALLKDSSIIVFDEPSSALDSDNTQIVNNLIKEISSEKLVLLISHEDNDFSMPCVELIFENKTINAFQRDCCNCRRKSF